MSRVRPLLRVVLAAAAAVSLAGCITLLPKSKPAHLYRFGVPASPAALTAPAGKIGVFRTHSTFQREAAGDRLLTVTGGEIAYVAQTRWVEPAVVLWDEAFLAAFDADPGPVRIISRGEPAAADYILRLDVRNFETRYDHGAKAPPTVVVRVRAALTSGKERGLVGEQIFEKQVTAADNRVSAIVPAYDQAVQGVLKDIIAWTDDLAKPS
jgi:cholesterol transport system auxiliary component